jgi:hypothetical protein
LRRLGGTIESRQDDQLVVTIPAGALAALKSDPTVLYLQRVGGPADDESPLIGEPADPQPGAPSKRFTPRALGTITWDSGTYAPPLRRAIRNEAGRVSAPIKVKKRDWHSSAPMPIVTAFH